MLKKTKAFSSFSVKDLKKAKEFYGKKLGVKVSQSKMGLSLEIPGTNTIFVYEKKNHKPATFTVLNFEVKDIDKTVNDLKKRGVKFEIYKTGQMKTDKNGILRDPRGSMAIAWFKDPAGNFLSVINTK